jgi:hypothetical protein
MERKEPGAFDLEIVDVFADPRRILREGVLVTPTLVAKDLGSRVAGDPSNGSRLDYFFESLLKLRSGKPSAP